MNYYELLFVLKPTLTDEENTAQIEKIKDSIVAQGADIVANDDMGMRRLAYPVEKNERGYYTVSYFTAPAVAIAEVERQLRINEDVLKFMTLRFSSKKEIGQFTKLTEAVAKKNAPAPVEEAPEAPAPEAPEAPAVETSAPEAPATETPATETPAVETPEVETPAAETETKSEEA